jgi:hypothetical protein
MKVTVKSTSEARVVESFQTAAGQARRAATELANFANGVVVRMDGGFLHTTDGLPSTAEAYVRADAQMKTLWTLLPSGLTPIEIANLMSPEYVSIKVAQEVD